MTDLFCDQVVWVNFSPVVGPEQAGHRPAVIVSSDEYLAAIPNIVIVLPITTRDRGLPNHIQLHGNTGLEDSSFAMTEQPRTIDRRRVTRAVGQLDQGAMREIRRCLARFLATDER
ncbi:mRNA interferase MazF [Antricoccus suffuscus]|uniref:mRNA interferase n=1 Tax=Antricoccus suffuscus TaxID=1629062 RepID=A0A2T1A3X5_9ACTN|nr:type II toxin-antitoxin system PemK/MazF family toxin [Antricoccus suffuscus]PRZ43008.1 mRNA interferase MazF [Antricoccus suffuscus]